MTGVAQLNDELPGKHIDIMREISPRLRRVGQLVDTAASGCTPVEESSRRAAASIGATLISYNVASRADLDRVFSQMQTERPDVLLPPARRLSCSTFGMFFSKMRYACVFL